MSKKTKIWLFSGLGALAGRLALLLDLDSLFNRGNKVGVHFFKRLNIHNAPLGLPDNLGAVLPEELRIF